MYFIGVDGGGSKTFSVVVDEQGNLLGSGVSGCGNHQIIGLNLAISHIRESMEMALQEAQLNAADIDYVQYSLAGADRETDFKKLEPALAELAFPRWNLVCDTMEGLRAGSPENIGVVLVCGSGTNAAGRNRAGETAQVGGFGSLFGDRTGGDVLAQQAFSGAVRAWEGRERETLLTRLIPESLNFAGMDELVAHYLDHEIDDAPLGLSIVLNDASLLGDHLAIEILEHAGQELALSAIAVIRKLGGFEDETIPIVLVGSVLQSGRNPNLIKTLQARIEEEYPAVQLVIPDIAPVYGAVLLAFDYAGIKGTEEILEKFKRYGGHIK